MPCDSITTQSVNLKNAIPDILRGALEDLGLDIIRETKNELTASTYGERVFWTKGKGLTVKGTNTTASIKKITQAYSSRAVSWAAQRAGWKVAQTGNNTLTVNRRQ